MAYALNELGPGVIVAMLTWSAAEGAATTRQHNVACERMPQALCMCTTCNGTVTQSKKHHVTATVQIEVWLCLLLTGRLNVTRKFDCVA